MVVVGPVTYSMLVDIDVYSFGKKKLRVSCGGQAIYLSEVGSRLCRGLAISLSNLAMIPKR